jgi:hypothetical protein
MSKRKTFYTIASLVVVIFAGSMAFVYTQIPLVEINSSGVTVSTSTKQKITKDTSALGSTTKTPDPKTTSPADATTTQAKVYAFYGGLREKVGSENMNGQPAQQFAVSVDDRNVFNEQTHNVQGRVIISTDNLSLKGGSSSSSSGSFEFYATYNTSKNWYEIIKMTFVVVDFY